MTIADTGRAGAPSRSPLADYAPVERMHVSLLLRFWDEFYASNRPIVVLGAMDDWEAMRAWTPSYFGQLLDGMRYPLRVTDDEIEYAFVDHTKREMSVADYIAALEAEDLEGSRRPYFGNIPMAAERTREWFEPVSTHYRFPSVLEDRIGEEVRFWIGARGQKSSIHNDSNHGFNAQVYGRKQFVLYAPDQHPHLATRRITDETWASQIEWDQPDLAVDPEFAAADGFEVTLEPGEMLYIPAFWWHAAKAVSTSINVNIWIFTADIGKWAQ